ncbi:MAG: sialidase family protein, partial [Terriglobia bacterium]
RCMFVKTRVEKMIRSIGHSGSSRVIAKSATLVGAWLVVCILGHAQRPSENALFTRGRFTEVRLKGLTVRLGDPVEITSQIGWHMNWPQHNTWSFVHLTPIAARFPNGELIVTYTLDPDTQANPIFLSGFQMSKDGGEHWGLRYGVIMQHIPMIFIPQPDDSLMALPSELMSQTPGDDRNLRGPLWRFEQGGKRMVMEPDGVRVVSWPWPVTVEPGTQPRPNWHHEFMFTGSWLKIGGRLLATVYWGKKGEKNSSGWHVLNLALADSVDGGHTWHYYSTIASPSEILPQAEWDKKRFEGPNESSIIRLADGELMVVFRVGSYLGWHLRRAYSRDNGRTWTKPDVLPAYSVEPRMLRIANGTIVLATGRPGIHLWLSTDARARTWQDVDIVAHHNQWAPNASYRIAPLDPNNPQGGWQTSSYTGLIEVAPNRLLLVYDRDPERAPAGPEDLSRVFVLPIEVQRQ